MVGGGRGGEYVKPVLSAILLHGVCLQGARDWDRIVLLCSKEEHRTSLKKKLEELNATELDVALWLDAMGSIAHQQVCTCVCVCVLCLLGVFVLSNLSLARWVCVSTGK